MIFTEAILGTVTGLIGNVVTGFIKTKQMKLDLQKEQMNFDHEKEMRKFDQDDMRLESELAVQRIDAETDSNLRVSEMNNIGIALKQESKPAITERSIEKLLEGRYSRFIGMALTFMLGIVEVLRKGIRPSLTYYMVALSTLVSLKCLSILESVGQLEQVFSEAFAQEMIRENISMVWYLAVTLTTWWFGERSQMKKMNIQKT